MIKLRPYQQNIKDRIITSWMEGNNNVLAVLPTGAGKTVTFSGIIHDHKGASCAIAHRQELVGQISLALARDGVRHKIIGPKNVVKKCVKSHMKKLGRSYYDPNSLTGVAGVDTLVRREKELAVWRNKVTLWVQDEAHHVLRSNKWGKAVEMFPNAKGLGVTATPERADGRGLGSHADGVFDDMQIGPTMRDLIDMQYLTDYRIFAPPNDIDTSSIAISKTTGDYNPNQLKTAVRNSHVIGDVVKHYLKIAHGKLGITFATDVETATDIANQFNAAGVPAAVVSAKTPDHEREAIIERFERRELMQLVNVDLFGEGFDLPAIEVVSMARPTQSYGLYVQQFGRALRLMDGKLNAIIIDHVGNVERHGLPDASRAWSLDAREKRSKGGPNDVIPLRTCLNVECLAVYERLLKKCPECGHVHVPAVRNGPEFVDGDLTELDAGTLAKMRGDVSVNKMSIDDYKSKLIKQNVPKVVFHTNVKRHAAKLSGHSVLSDVIEQWAGYHRSVGRIDDEIYKRFYFKFGVDMMTIQTLPLKDVRQYINLIMTDMGRV